MKKKKSSRYFPKYLDVFLPEADIIQVVAPNLSKAEVNIVRDQLMAVAKEVSCYKFSPDRQKDTRNGVHMNNNFLGGYYGIYYMTIFSSFFLNKIINGVPVIDYILMTNPLVMLDSDAQHDSSPRTPIGVTDSSQVLEALKVLASYNNPSVNAFTPNERKECLVLLNVLVKAEFKKEESLNAFLLNVLLCFIRFMNYAFPLTSTPIDHQITYVKTELMECYYQNSFEDFFEQYLKSKAIMDYFGLIESVGKVENGDIKIDVGRGDGFLQPAWAERTIQLVIDAMFTNVTTLAQFLLIKKEFSWFRQEALKYILSGDSVITPLNLDKELAIGSFSTPKLINTVSGIKEFEASFFKRCGAILPDWKAMVNEFFSDVSELAILDYLPMASVKYAVENQRKIIYQLSFTAPYLRNNFLFSAMSRDHEANPRFELNSEFVTDRGVSSEVEQYGPKTSYDKSESSQDAYIFTDVNDERTSKYLRLLRLLLRELIVTEGDSSSEGSPLSDYLTLKYSTKISTIVVPLGKEAPIVIKDFKNVRASTNFSVKTVDVMSCSILDLYFSVSDEETTDSLERIYYQRLDNLLSPKTFGYYRYLSPVPFKIYYMASEAAFLCYLNRSVQTLVLSALRTKLDLGPMTILDRIIAIPRYQFIDVPIHPSNLDRLWLNSAKESNTFKGWKGDDTGNFWVNTSLPFMFTNSEFLTAKVKVDLLNDTTFKDARYLGLVTEKVTGVEMLSFQYAPDLCDEAVRTIFGMLEDETVEDYEDIADSPNELDLIIRILISLFYDASNGTVSEDRVFNCLSDIISFINGYLNPKGSIADSGSIQCYLSWGDLVKFIKDYLDTDNASPALTCIRDLPKFFEKDTNKVIFNEFFVPLESPVNGSIFQTLKDKYFQVRRPLSSRKLINYTNMLLPIVTKTNSLQAMIGTLTSRKISAALRYQLTFKVDSLKGKSDNKKKSEK